ncbi:MAG: hypothetical protein ACI976_003003 [Aureispira sp.]|jgi:hypothetical protein
MLEKKGDPIKKAPFIRTNKGGFFRFYDARKLKFGNSKLYCLRFSKPIGMCWSYSP